MSFDIFDAVCKSWTWPQKLQKLVERDLPKCESHAEELKAEVNKAKGHGINCKPELLIALRVLEDSISVLLSIYCTSPISGFAAA